MSTSAPPAVITFADVLDVLLPRDVLPPGVGGACLRVVAGAGDQRPAEAWFCRGVVSEWAQQVRLHPGEQPTSLASFVAAHPASVSFSPLAWSGIGGWPAGPALAVWATLAIPLDPMPGFPGVRRADPAALARALAQVAAVPLPPSVVLDEGDGVTVFWCVEEPLSDLVRLAHLNHLAANRLRGHWAPAESLTAAVVLVPACRNPALLPAPDVTVTEWAPDRRYTMAELVAAVGG